MAKVHAEDMAAAYDELVERYGTDFRPSNHEIRELAKTLGQDREIEQAKVDVMVASIEDADLAYGKGTDMARKAAYQLGLRDMFASRKTLAAYLVDQGLSWYDVAKMNS